MPRWSKKKEGRILASLFDSGLADPNHLGPADIDLIQGMKDEFKAHSVDNFRKNYRNTAREWFTGKAVAGTRLEALKLSDKAKQKPVPQKEEPEKEDEPGDDDDEEEEVEEDFIEQELFAKLPEKAMAMKPATVTKCAYKYKEDEVKWQPIFKSSKFISNGYHREELIVEPPASFDGADGTYQISFENNNTVLLLKIAPNAALSDPHDINGYYRQKYGIVTAADSARDQAFKASSKGISDKWYTFRHQLGWQGKPSEDLEGSMPWLDFADIDSQGRVFPLLIINLCSIKPVEEKQRSVTGGLVRNKFKSPPKSTGAKEPKKGEQNFMQDRVQKQMDDERARMNQQMYQQQQQMERQMQQEMQRQKERMERQMQQELHRMQEQMRDATVRGRSQESRGRPPTRDYSPRSRNPKTNRPHTRSLSRSRGVSDSPMAGDGSTFAEFQDAEDGLDV